MQWVGYKIEATTPLAALLLSAVGVGERHGASTRRTCLLAVAPHEQQAYAGSK